MKSTRINQYLSKFINLNIYPKLRSFRKIENLRSKSNFDQYYKINFQIQEKSKKVVHRINKFQELLQLKIGAIFQKANRKIKLLLLKAK